MVLKIFGDTFVVTHALMTARRSISACSDITLVQSVCNTPHGNAIKGWQKMRIATPGASCYGKCAHFMQDAPIFTLPIPLKRASDIPVRTLFFAGIFLVIWVVLVVRVISVGVFFWFGSQLTNGTNIPHTCGKFIVNWPHASI